MAAPLKQIPVGEKCQIQVGHGKYLSVIRGYVFPKYLFMDAPVEHGKPVDVPKDIPYVVRFVFAGIIYGFTAKFIKNYNTPIGLLVLTYPEDVQAVSLRKSKRISTFLPTVLETGGKLYPGAIVDLSEGGCLFIAERSDLVPGKTCRLHMNLPTGKKVTALPSVMRSATHKGSKTHFGISFDQKENEALTNIRSFYLSCMEHLF